MNRPTYSPDIILGTAAMQSTFLFSYNKMTATCFLYHGEHGAFFLTANHTLSRAQAGDFVLFRRDEGWVQLEITGIWRDKRGYDVCAFTVDEFSVSGPLIATKTGGLLFPGEPTKFLGFPHGIHGNFPGQGWPTPLVRTAFFSGVIVSNGLDIMILDGFNNPGFSGGPIYVSYENETSLFGVVSGYRTERESHSQIYRRDEDGNEEIIPDLYIKPNSGLIISIGFQRLEESLIPNVDRFLHRT